MRTPKIPEHAKMTALAQGTATALQVLTYRIHAQRMKNFLICMRTEPLSILDCVSSNNQQHLVFRYLRSVTAALNSA